MISCLDYVNEKKFFLKEQVFTFKNKPRLAVIQVGDNSASNVYIRNKKNVCDEIGILFSHIKLEENISESKLIATINLLSMDANVHGIIVQLPLPKHIDEKNVINSIAKEKDVDGFRVDSLFKPCTPKGIIDWLRYNRIDLVGKDVCVIGRSKIVGQPLVQMFGEEHSTVVWCNSKTKDIRSHIKNSDIVVSAIGKANYFDSSYFREGQIVIDVGINRDLEGKLCGDICNDVLSVVKYKTPVPNGVGKLTVCSLMENVIKAYKLNGGS